jgi:hypothetical protein
MLGERRRQRTKRRKVGGEGEEGRRELREEGVITKQDARRKEEAKTEYEVLKVE